MSGSGVLPALPCVRPRAGSHIAAFHLGLRPQRLETNLSWLLSEPRFLGLAFEWASCATIDQEIMCTKQSMISRCLMQLGGEPAWLLGHSGARCCTLSLGVMMPWYQADARFKALGAHAAPCVVGDCGSERGLHAWRFGTPWNLKTNSSSWLCQIVIGGQMPSLVSRDHRFACALVAKRPSRAIVVGHWVLPWRQHDNDGVRQAAS
jgi:hypothetical protein